MDWIRIWRDNDERDFRNVDVADETWQQAVSDFEAGLLTSVQREEYLDSGHTDGVILFRREKDGSETRYRSAKYDHHEPPIVEPCPGDVP